MNWPFFDQNSEVGKVNYTHSRPLWCRLIKAQMLSKTKGNKIMQAKIRCLFSVISTDLFMNQFDFFAFRVELFSFVSKWQLETKKECLTITKIKENDQNTRKLCLDIFNSTWLIMSAPFNKDLLSATVWKKKLLSLENTFVKITWTVLSTVVYVLTLISRKFCKLMAWVNFYNLHTVKHF